MGKHKPASSKQHEEYDLAESEKRVNTDKPYSRKSWEKGRGGPIEQKRAE